MDETLYERLRTPANRTRLDDPLAVSSADAAGLPDTPTIGVIRNPRSHRNRGSGENPDRLPANTPNVHVAAPFGREKLTEKLAEFAALPIDVLIIDGGDGTVREVLTCGSALFGERWPRLIILPNGKTNALAVDLGMPERWTLADALHFLSRDRARAQVVRRRPMVVDRPDIPRSAGDDRQIMGFILGAGVFNTAIETAQVAHRFGAFQGLAVGATAAFAVVQALFGFGRSRWRRQAPMRIETIGPQGAVAVPHSKHGAQDSRFGVGFSTLRRFPLNLQPFRPDDGDIRFVMLDAPLRRSVALIPAVLWGHDRAYLSDLGFHRGAAQQVALTFGEGFILDGEAFPAGQYRLRLGPELQFLTP